MEGHCGLTCTGLGRLDLAVGELDADLWLRDDPAAAFAGEELFRGHVLDDFLGLAESLHGLRSGHAGGQCGCWDGLVAEFPGAGLDKVADLRDAAARAAGNPGVHGGDARAVWDAVTAHLDGLREVVARYGQ